MKYDVFAGPEQVATLVTNNRKTCALTSEGQKLSLKARWKWFDGYYYYLSDEAGNRVATIFVRRRPFGKDIYQVTFDKNNYVCHLARKTRRIVKEANADFIYEITRDHQTVCTIINYRKPPFLSAGPHYPLEGTIQFGDDLGIIEILCLLQSMNVHIDLVFGGD